MVWDVRVYLGLFKNEGCGRVEPLGCGLGAPDDAGALPPEAFPPPACPPAVFPPVDCPPTSGTANNKR